MNKKGITLIALVITVIVLLILAGVVISIGIGGDGLFEKTNNAVEKWNAKATDEEIKINEALNILDNILPSEIQIKMTLRTNNEIDGTEVTLTKDNYAEHLGKIVTKYTGPATVTIGANTYNVSTQYRLYYIDWDNKYKDGVGTIYLKADVPLNSSNNYLLEKEEAPIDEENSTTAIIKKLNPELYKEGYSSAPTKDSDNMQAVRWLLNENNWLDLENSTYSEKTNYIVGAPSLEMMVDSYNTHYGVNRETINTSPRTQSATTRIKLFYKYPFRYGDGYGVGPSDQSNAIDGYATYTSKATVQPDQYIDSMYYPDSFSYYWLASPSDAHSKSVCLVSASNRGDITAGNYNNYTTVACFCPLVSLQPDVQL